MKKIGSLFALVALAALVVACASAAAPAVEGRAAQQPHEAAKDLPAEEPIEEAAAEEEFYVEEPLEEAEAPAGAVMPQAAPTAAALAGESAEPDAPPPDAMFFEDYGTNPFVDASQDNLSTFAVDVDTGSYTLARSYLNDYYLPPPEAIRLEEFVNYFDQDYPLPQQSAFNIVMEAAPTPFSVENSVVLRVGLQGYEVAPEDRPDATLIFVVDVSGSMEGPERLGAVKAALLTLLDELRPGDSIGIVVYGSKGRVVLEPTPVSERNKIEKAINKLQSSGSTFAEEGLRLAYEQATAHYDPQRINRLILCSDGVANVGETGPDAILEIVRQQAREGITVTTVGFGMGNYNDVLMEQLADDGDGQYFYVDSQAEAERIFAHELTGTLLTIAKDAKVQVDFNPEAVVAYRLMGYENRDVADEDFRNDEVDAGEIGAGHSVTALYEVVLAEQAQGTVATVHLRWEDPDSGDVTEIEHSLGVADVLSDFGAASPRFKLDVVVAAFADVLGEGAWAQTVGLAELLDMAADIADELSGDPEVQELVDLIRLAMELRGQ
jgi:Ca-activated chloride channel family protein